MKKERKSENADVRQRARLIAAELKRLFPHAEIALNYGNHWELLVAVVLSAQCTDKKVNEVTSELFKKYRKLEDYVAAEPEEFEQDIKSTGFYRNKAKNILASARLVKEKYNGRVPKDMADLLSLPEGSGQDREGSDADFAAGGMVRLQLPDDRLRPQNLPGP